METAFREAKQVSLWGHVCFLMSAAASRDIGKHWEGAGGRAGRKRHWRLEVLQLPRAQDACLCG